MSLNELKQVHCSFLQALCTHAAITLNFLWFLLNSKNPALLRWLFGGW